MNNPSPRKHIPGIGILVLLFILGGFFIISRPAQAAVIFTRFIAIPGDSQVSVQWTTSSEINTTGFYVVSSSSEVGSYTRVSSFFPRQGTGITGASYEFVHTGLTNGLPIYYKIEIINNDLTSIFTGAISTIPNPPTATPTQTLTLTPTLTLTLTLTATPSLTLTPTVSATGTTTATITMTLTPTRTITITPTRTYTLVPSATRRPATAVPTRTLVRIMTNTSQPTTGTGTQATSSGGSYPEGTGTSVITTLDTTGTVTPGESEGGSKYPGETTPDLSTTPSTEAETDEPGFITQGTPIPFQTPTPTGQGGKANSEPVLGWIIGIGIGLVVLSGAAWFYIRSRKSGDHQENDLFKDDPE